MRITLNILGVSLFIEWGAALYEDPAPEDEGDGAEVPTVDQCVGFEDSQ